MKSFFVMQESEARLMEVKEHRASPLRENVGSQKLPKSHGASVHEAQNIFYTALSR